jgi:hypothetical protein
MTYGVVFSNIFYLLIIIKKFSYDVVVLRVMDFSNIFYLLRIATPIH